MGQVRAEAGRRESRWLERRYQYSRSNIVANVFFGIAELATGRARRNMPCHLHLVSISLINALRVAPTALLGQPRSTSNRVSHNCKHPIVKTSIGPNRERTAVLGDHLHLNAKATSLSYRTLFCKAFDVLADVSLLPTCPTSYLYNLSKHRFCPGVEFHKSNFEHHRMPG